MQDVLRDNLLTQLRARVDYETHIVPLFHHLRQREIDEDICEMVLSIQLINNPTLQADLKDYIHASKHADTHTNKHEHETKEGVTKHTNMPFRKDDCLIHDSVSLYDEGSFNNHPLQDWTDDMFSDASSDVRKCR